MEISLVLSSTNGRSLETGKEIATETEREMLIDSNVCFWYEKLIGPAIDTLFTATTRFLHVHTH